MRMGGVLREEDGRDGDQRSVKIGASYPIKIIVTNLVEKADVLLVSLSLFLSLS